MSEFIPGVPRCAEQSFSTNHTTMTNGLVLNFLPKERSIKPRTKCTNRGNTKRQSITQRCSTRSTGLKDSLQHAYWYNSCKSCITGTLPSKFSDESLQRLGGYIDVTCQRHLRALFPQNVQYKENKAQIWLLVSGNLFILAVDHFWNVIFGKKVPLY